MKIPLWCPTHDEHHSFTAGEIERIVYALSAGLAEEATASDINDRHLIGAAFEDALSCPLEVLGWSRDGEMYAEHTGRFVAMREASQRVDAEVIHNY